MGNSPACASEALRPVLTVRLEAAEDLGSGDGLDLGDTVRVTEDDTDLGGGETLAREAEDVLVNLLSRDLEPLGG